jgi:hypothetical protein
MRAVVIVSLVMLASASYGQDSVLARTSFALQSAPVEWSPCSGIGTTVGPRMEIPDNAVAAQFEFEVLEYTSNLGTPCFINLDFPWEVGSPFNHFSVRIGSCDTFVLPGMGVQVAAGSRGFDHLLGFTSLSARIQAVESSVCYGAVNQRIYFSARIELRAIGQVPVSVETVSWSAMRALYR